MKITEAEYNLKLALEENKELKVKLDAVVEALEIAIKSLVFNRGYMDLPEDSHTIIAIKQGEQALAQAQKGK